MTILRFRRFALPAAALLFTAFFFVTTFRMGWTRSTTDFPNYYTAAVMARKGLPLRHYYDWTWFQRQMNFAGIEPQLGGYIPQTPVTMLPFIPLSWLPAQDAKRVWLVLNLFFLAAALWMLTSMTRLSMAELAIILYLGYGAVHINFFYGQYYIFLLFLLTGAILCFARGRVFSGGAVLGSRVRAEALRCSFPRLLRVETSMASACRDARLRCRLRRCLLAVVRLGG